MMLFCSRDWSVYPPHQSKVQNNPVYKIIRSFLQYSKPKMVFAFTRAFAECENHILLATSRNNLSSATAIVESLIQWTCRVFSSR